MSYTFSSAEGVVRHVPRMEQLFNSIVAKTASETITDWYLVGTMFTNTGATGTVTITLPTPRERAMFWFHRSVTGQTFNVKAGEGIYLNGSAAGTVAVSSIAVVFAVDTTHWILCQNPLTGEDLDATGVASLFATSSFDATNCADVFAAGAIPGSKLASHEITHTQLASSVEKYADVTITPGQLLALNNTAQILVAAPAAGYANVPTRLVLFLDFATTPYDGIASGEDLAVKYTDKNGTQIMSVETDPFLASSADATVYAPAPTTLLTPTPAAALVLHLLTGEIANGDSPLIVRTYYKTIPTTR